MNTASDKYSDSLDGRPTSDARWEMRQNPQAPNHQVQCEMCGSMLKIPKPKRSRYTVACTYPECGHIMKFG